MYHFPFWPTFENTLEVLSYIFGVSFEVSFHSFSFKLVLHWLVKIIIVFSVVLLSVTLVHVNYHMRDFFKEITSCNLDRCHPDIRIFSVTDSSGEVFLTFQPDEQLEKQRCLLAKNCYLTKLIFRASFGSPLC